jgi:chaperonin cofactor prefoldin
MVEQDPRRATGLKAFETQAEKLMVHQLDLVAQLEAQLRAVHHTMRAIEKMRAARYRVGRELSNGERGTTLEKLADEIQAIDAELQVQHQSCLDMQHSIREMQARLAALRAQAAPAQSERADTAESEGSSQA